MKPRLSIIIPYHRGESFIQKTLESIDSQFAYEILVLIDEENFPFSISSSTQIINTKSKNISSKLNEGLSKAKGEFIVFLDQDDLFVPASLDRKVTWLLHHPEESAVLEKVAGFIDEKDLELKDLNLKISEHYALLPSVITLDYLKNGGWFPLRPLGSGLFRHTPLQKVGLFNSELHLAQDRDYFYRLLSYFYIPFVNAPSLIVRLHTQNASTYFSNKEIQLKPKAKAESILTDTLYDIARF